MQDKVVIITGASSGIGAATARLLAPLGAKLVLTARSVDKLEALAAELGTSTLVVPGDVTAAADVHRVVSGTLERFGRVDVLMANAGIYIPGNFHEGDPDAFAQLLDVNINGVLRFAHAVLPHMLAQGSGDVLVTSSISGHIDIHWEPVYSGSKHAIQAWCHGVRRQVMGKGVRVMSLAPGMVANELWGIYAAEAIAEHVRNRSALTSEDCAEAALFMLTRPPHVTIRDLVMLPQNQDI
ncbi:MAG: SDR family oxidoreductase [Caldilineaceae bacterium]